MAGLNEHFAKRDFKKTREPVAYAKFEGDIPEGRPDDEAVVAGVALTHPERVLYPATETTKLDVAEYYAAAFKRMRPFLEDRPLSLVRCQETAADACFYQKNSGPRGLVVRTKPVHYREKRGRAFVADTEGEFMRLIQGGALEVHAWGARFAKITKPDQLVFDLDPESSKLWSGVIEAALAIREKLAERGLKSFVKVTGGKGLHVQVPLVPRADWNEAKAFAKELMEELVAADPKHFTVNPLKADRKGKIYLDYLRNSYGATSILPYCLRAKERPTVALPIAWSDVKRELKPGGFELIEARRRLRLRDPWADYHTVEQSI